MSESCDICCFDFNNSTRSLIKCKNKDCKLNVCKTCVRKYISSQSNDAHCMECKIAYDDNFIVMNLNRNWYEKEYKNHRKSILLEKQMARMPDTVEAVDRFKKINLLMEKNEEYRKQIKFLKKQLRNIQKLQDTNIQEMYKIKNKELSTQKRKFIMACADSECRGYLSSAYKCEICKKFTCSSCLNIIGLDKHNHDHKCNEDDVKTADFIKNTTKPCPGCGERIHKIQGCDQMWCTNCHVAFSWKTGIIDNGVVHNPHFYAHQFAIANNQQVQQINCNELPRIWTLNNIFRTKFRNFKTQDWNKFIRKIFELHRNFTHIQQVDLIRARDKVRNLSNLEQDRINFLIKNISQIELGNIAIKKDKQRKKYTELIHIYELVHTISVDLFRWILHYIQETNDSNSFEIINTINTKIEEIENIRKYVNKQLGNISISYNIKVPQFNPLSWEITKKKFSLKKVKTQFKSDV